MLATLLTTARRRGSLRLLAATMAVGWGLTVLSQLRDEVTDDAAAAEARLARVMEAEEVTAEALSEARAQLADVRRQLDDRREQVAAETQRLNDLGVTTL